MNLEDKAEESPTVYLAGSLTESEYRLTTTELVGADELTPEGEFPQYGDFLEVQERSPVDGTDRGTVHVEVPSALARWLVEHVEKGDWWTVNGAEKGEDGTWRFRCELVERGEQKSLETAAEAMTDD